MGGAKCGDLKAAGIEEYCCTVYKNHVAFINKSKDKNESETLCSMHKTSHKQIKTKVWFDFLNLLRIKKKTINLNIFT